MKILVTGSAGFIGANLTHTLLSEKYEVVGIDNHNSYYDPQLKEDRLNRLLSYDSYEHVRTDIAHRENLMMCFKLYCPEIVIHLAAQAGVRYADENPSQYIESNILGFANVLEACRHFGVKHLVYASSSSVYGANKVLPYSTQQTVSHPLSLYAATKTSNELMAHAYSHLYGLPTTGLRLFTVYGPWGRPDMSYFKFVKNIIDGKSVEIYNNGQHLRDFTYIDDVVQGLIKVIRKNPVRNIDWSDIKPDLASSHAPWRIYNLGHNQPILLMDFLSKIEVLLRRKASKDFLPMQAGDVFGTWADTSDFKRDFSFTCDTSVDLGLERFIYWYQDYYKTALTA